MRRTHLLFFPFEEDGQGVHEEEEPMALLLDPLYCPEEHLDLEQEEELHDHATTLLPFPAEPSAMVADCVELCSSLAAKEAATQLHLPPDLDAAGDHYLRAARTEAVEWVVSAAARHGFSALTALLAVNYLDRCLLRQGGGGAASFRLQGDKPWMAQLAAAACLSLAAKVEETHVPLLLDLQVPAAVEAGYVFEARTVRRMELLVLSALGWRMNAVTALSFIQALLPLLCSEYKSANLAARLRRCEAILVSVLADRRWVQYSASVWAAAVLRHTSECGEDQRHLTAAMNAPKEKVGECHDLIAEHTGCNNNGGIGRKRKHLLLSMDHYSPPPSPSGVVGSCFSYESSSAPSSPEIRLFKRPTNCSTTDMLAEEEDGEEEEESVMA